MVADKRELAPSGDHECTFMFLAATQFRRTVIFFIFSVIMRSINVFVFRMAFTLASYVQNTICSRPANVRKPIVSSPNVICPVAFRRAHAPDLHVPGAFELK